jgi:hypothetical protein
VSFQSIAKKFQLELASEVIEMHTILQYAGAAVIGVTKLGEVGMPKANKKSSSAATAANVVSLR